MIGLKVIFFLRNRFRLPQFKFSEIKSLTMIIILIFANTLQQFILKSKQSNAALMHFYFYFITYFVTFILKISFFSMRIKKMAIAYAKHMRLFSIIKDMHGNIIFGLVDFIQKYLKIYMRTEKLLILNRYFKFTTSKIHKNIF